MALPGFIHTITRTRFGVTIDAEGTPVGALGSPRTYKGFMSEKREFEVAGDSGSPLADQVRYIRCLLPPDADVVPQDRLTVHHPRTTITSTYRVVGVRPSPLCMVADCQREVV